MSAYHLPVTERLECHYYYYYYYYYLLLLHHLPVTERLECGVTQRAVAARRVRSSTQLGPASQQRRQQHRRKLGEACRGGETGGRCGEGAGGLGFG